MDAPYCRHLADAKTDNIANIIRIDPWYQSWYQGHADAILGAVSNRLFFKLQERDVYKRQIDAWITEHEGFTDVYDYQYVCGAIAGFGSNGTLTLNDLNGNENTDNNYFYINDAENGDYIAGYDFTTGKELRFLT